MLWEEGQKRVGRERRERLTELYTAGVDAYVAGNVAIGVAKANGDVTPAYVRASAPASSIEAQRATLTRLAAFFPGSVVMRSDS